MTSCLDCFSFGGSGVGWIVHKPYMSLILNSESAVINTTAKKLTHLPFIGNNTDHELPHDFYIP